MNDPEAFFKDNNTTINDKWNHRFGIYENHFSKYRDKEVVLLEIGAFEGGSLQIWKHYLGDKAKIYGIDIRPDFKQLEEENISVMVGSRSDLGFLKEVIKTIPPIDILIDDGGHTIEQQIISFEALFGHVKPGGIYICEDLDSSRNKGGYEVQGGLSGHAKEAIGELNDCRVHETPKPRSTFTSSLNSLYHYDNMMVIEKKPLHKSNKPATISVPVAEETELKKTSWFKMIFK